MKYKQANNKILGKIFVASIHTISSKADSGHIIIAGKKTELKTMIKTTIKDALTRRDEVAWNLGTPYEVRMWKEDEFSDYDKEDSEFITTSTKTRTGAKDNVKVIIHHVKKRRNPDFVDNPECQFCYEKTTKLYNQTLLDDAKTPKKVCAKCNKDLKAMKVMMAEINAKKEITA